MKKKLVWLWLSMMVVLVIWHHALGGQAVVGAWLHEDARKAVFLGLLTTSLLALYAFVSVLLASFARRTGAKEGEVKMILGVVKGVLFFVGFLTALSEFFSLGTLGTIFAAFGGMFLG
ncbi:MAG: hypothetical protein FJ224_08395 [Lentisphaerae bacterium]|nr:hypothetical protein [Lentisphaerota bacterium]